MGTRNGHSVPFLKSASLKKWKRKAMKRIKKIHKISKKGNNNNHANHTCGALSFWGFVDLSDFAM